MRWAKLIEVAAWMFAGLGLLLPFALQTPVFALYVTAMERVAGIPPGSHRELFALMAGITGGTICGKWILHALIARFGLRQGARWARGATALGLIVWFVVDSAGSLAAGAWPNVVMVNGMPLLLVGVPLGLGWRRFAEPSPATPSNRPLEALGWIAVISGVAIALGGRTGLFAPWFAALEGSGLAEIDRELALAFFGPIGGTTAAHGALLIVVARRVRAAWVVPACLASVIGWFVVDSGYSLLHEGAFNVVMVNLPFVAVALPLLLWARRRPSGAPSQR